MSIKRFFFLTLVAGFCGFTGSFFFNFLFPALEAAGSKIGKNEIWTQELNFMDENGQRVGGFIIVDGEPQFTIKNPKGKNFQ